MVVSAVVVVGVVASTFSTECGYTGVTNNHLSLMGKGSNTTESVIGDWVCARFFLDTSRMLDVVVDVWVMTGFEYFSIKLKAGSRKRKDLSFSCCPIESGFALLNPAKVNTRAHGLV